MLCDANMLLMPIVKAGQATTHKDALEGGFIQSMTEEEQKHYTIQTSLVQACPGIQVQTSLIAVHTKNELVYTSSYQVHMSTYLVRTVSYRVRTQYILYLMVLSTGGLQLS